MAEPLVEVVRSGFVEGVHYGSVIAVRADGTPVVNVGPTNAPIFPRSSNKPLQALGMLRAGLDLDGADLAIAAASHSGEQMHLDRVRGLLHRAGVDENVLVCPPSLPLAEAARRTATPTRLAMNCSGQHAAMALTCVLAGWPVNGYAEPDHPLQKAIRGAVEDLSGETAATVGVDGCGAPIFPVSLAGLARAFGRLVTAADGSPERRVAEAMRARPELVGGTGRDDTVAMRAVPGLLMKGGAEGVHAAALPDGSAVALKISDGAARARMPVMAAALRRLGGVDLAQLATGPVLGGGRVVGEVRLRAGALG